MARKTGCISCIIFFICNLQFANVVIAQETSVEPSTWPGHMQPLGSHNVKHPVASIDEFPKPADFFRNYVAANKPVLIRNGAKASPAFKLWSDEYFLSLPDAANTTVYAEARKKENRTNPGQDISFKEFVEVYNDSDIYMVNAVPPVLQKDVCLPSALLCEDLRPHLVDTVMWFSSGGTKSVFHHDDVDNINCLYRGTKTLLFVDYQKYKGKLHLDNAWGGFSGVDIDKVDFTKYPIFHEVEFYKADMETGDCLFIPYKWYHQVTSVGRNIAVNIWWKHLHSFVPKQCNKTQPGATLDQFRFSSLEANGDDEGELTNDLLGMFAKRLKKQQQLSYDDFVRFLKENLQTEVKPEFESSVMEFIAHVFQLADIDKDGAVSSEDIAEIDDKKFEQLENDMSELEAILAEYHDPMYQGANNGEQDDLVHGGDNVGRDDFSYGGDQNEADESLHNRDNTEQADDPMDDGDKVEQGESLDLDHGDGGDGKRQETHGEL